MENVDYVLIGNSDGILKNLPYALQKAGFTTLAIAPSSANIYRSKFVNYKKKCSGTTIDAFIQSLTQIEEYLLGLDATFLWCSDEIMQKVSVSKLSVETKKHILPTRQSEHFAILNSKVGQISLLTEKNYKVPDSVVCENLIEFQKAFLKNSSKSICKGDSGGGGAFIRQFSTREERQDFVVPDSWFPVTVQEFIAGEDISAEAFFKNGELFHGTFSKTLLESNVYGPAVVREFSSEHSKFLEPVLRKLGKDFDIDGFANLTFRRDSSNEYFLIELDVRPNIWHGAFLELGVDIKDQMHKSASMRNPSGPYFEKFYEPERLYNHFKTTRQLSNLLACLQGDEISEFGRAISSQFVLDNQKFWVRAFNITDAVIPFRRVVLNALISLKRRTPKGISERIANSPIQANLIRLLA
jgi:hypothetical protein